MKSSNIFLLVDIHLLGDIIFLFNKKGLLRWLDYVKQEKQNKSVFLSLHSAMIFISSSSSLILICIWYFFSFVCETPDDESKFTYLLGTNEGPENWGNLKPEWKLCTTGKFQSPVNIRNKTVTVTTALQHLKPKYKIAPAIIINRGHDIKVYILTI